jgi:diaminohydroxyphosphoribosylaminopyrimidine deaminase/5-amino-6-(5-phosphoribosylamino)uracil reductase
VGVEPRRPHEVRAAHDAILVGTGTVLADDPSLTARGDGGELLVDQPMPVVVGDRAVPAGARLRSHPRELVHVAGHDPAAALDELWRRGVRSVLVEGGPTVASAFVRAADQRRGEVDQVVVGEAGARTALDDLGVATIDDQRCLRVADVTLLGTDLLIVARDDTRSTS